MFQEYEERPLADIVFVQSVEGTESSGTIKLAIMDVAGSQVIALPRQTLHMIE